MKEVVHILGTEDQHKITVTNNYQITKDAKRKKIETKVAHKRITGLFMING